MMKGQMVCLCLKNKGSAVRFCLWPHMKDRLKYWYKKYLPKFIIKFSDKLEEFFFKILNGYKYAMFETNIRRQVRDASISYSVSVDDDEAYFNHNLIEKSLYWLSKANEIKLSHDVNKPGYKFYNQFPGEHYRLLAAICSLEKPNVVIDIGTYTGMSSRVMLDYSNAKVLTFDLVHWKEFDSYLNINDFKSNRISQSLDDLSKLDNFDKYKSIFRDSDLIFLDGPKNVIFEEKLLDLFFQLEFPRKKRYLIVDDIKFPAMFNFWRKINSPKIDLSSFGHWSGTGVVDISKGIDIKKIKE